MPFGSPKLPKPTPPPSQDEVKQENKALAEKRQLSLERALQAQRNLGASQLKSPSAGMRYS